MLLILGVIALLAISAYLYALVFTAGFRDGWVKENGNCSQITIHFPKRVFHKVISFYLKNYPTGGASDNSTYCNAKYSNKSVNTNNSLAFGMCCCLTQCNPSNSTDPKVTGDCEAKCKAQFPTII